MKIKLNKIQRQAVEANEGPVLIFAGAGSGKTKVLTQKIHRLIEIEKFKSENILSVTFTNKAAKEMKTRVMSLLKTKKLGISIGTFHSICARLNRNEAKNIGLNPQFAIYDVQDQLDLYKVVLKVLNISKDLIKPNQARSQISLLKNKMITPEEQLKKSRTIFDKKLVDIYKLYQKMLRENDALDFDDLLLFPLQIFNDYPKILEKYQNLWKYILVDEYQDTNKPQFCFLSKIAENHKNICVVGDDDQ